MNPFVRAEVIPPADPEKHIQEMAEALKMPVDMVRKCYNDIERRDEIYANDVYQVAVRRHPPGDDPTNISDIDVIHLSIKRRDKEPIHDWRDLQEIKNMLTDPEFEAVEVYPAESRLVDTSNQYHLWVFANKEFRVPVGFPGRLVYDGPGAANTKQRPRKGANL